MYKNIIFLFCFLTANFSFGGDVIGVGFFPGTAEETGIKGLLTKTPSGEKIVAESENRYDVYDFVMSEFQKDDFKPIPSTVTNYTTKDKIDVNFTVGCRDGEYIVMGLKPDAHVLVWVNPYEYPDTCISDIE